MVIGWGMFVSAADIELSLIGDTYLNVDTGNYHSSAHLKTYTWPAQRIANVSILQWEMSPIPSGSMISVATLSLFLEDWFGVEPYRVTVHRIINNTPRITHATGFTYDGVNNWTANNCCYNNIPMAQADIGPVIHSLSVSELAGYKSWHVTSILQQWVDDSNTNRGILVNADPAAAVDRYRYFSSMNGYIDRRPLLLVIYTPPPISHRSITLRWRDTSDNESGFYVERRPYPSGSFTRETELGLGTVTWTNVFPEREERCYRVQAFNAAGTSGYSNEVCACRKFTCRDAVTNRPPVVDRPIAPSRPPIP